MLFRSGRTRETRRDELVIRFQQACGAVMAKGVEDTAFYRWTHLVSLCEVGGAPERFAISTDELHAWAIRAQHLTPVAMTTLSTHDTKRSADVRARIGVLSELPLEWSELVDRVRAATAEIRPAALDGRTENLLWQTLAGTWDNDGPIAVNRLTEYLLKVVREAKEHTSWTTPDDAYERSVLDFAREALTVDVVVEAFEGWRRRSADGVRAAILGTALVQLTLPGVPDVYQGTEVPTTSLVDPDNRRPVDMAALAASLDRVDAEGPRTLTDEKLLITSRALRTRREHASAFTGLLAGYQPLPCSSGNAIAFARADDGAARTVTVATRLALSLERLGGWGEHTVVLPDEIWLDVLTGRDVPGGVTRLSGLLATLPVALLVARDER